jgi:CDP-glucose 4,6-dehydratase
MLDPDFWRGRKVLMTGHTGFKGSWLSLWLQQLGAEVTGFALAPPTEPSLFELADVAAGMDSRRGDIRDLAAVVAAVEAAAPEIVLHLAAESVVSKSYADPVNTYATNVMGTVHLFEAVRRVGGVRAVVNVTSDKCYENTGMVWGYRENEPMGGFDPYSNSKGCAELVTAAYRRSFFGGDGAPAIGSGRAGNVVGGGDWTAHQLVPDVMAALLGGRPIRLRSPRAVRPWQFVLEPLAGYLLLAERLASPGGAAFAQGWNFGPAYDDCWPVARIVARLIEVWGAGEWIDDSGGHFHEAGYLKLDSSLAQERLGWRPRLALPTALAWVAEWYRAYQRGGDVGALTRNQIRRFAAPAAPPAAGRQ